MKDTKRKFAIITVDTNDGDYESHTIEITEEQALVLSRVAIAIKTFKPYTVDRHDLVWTFNHNFPTGDCLRADLSELSPKEYYVETNKITEEDFQDFMGLMPYCEFGFHTVIGIRILAVIGDIRLI